MIRSLKVDGLNRYMSFDLVFHEDINVVTGRNGSGKTTLLKLLWYAISGHLNRLFAEISFESFELRTDRIRLIVSREVEPSGSINRIGCEIDGGPRGETTGSTADVRFRTDCIMIGRQVANASGSSIFLPTFRRIERGLSVSADGDELGDPAYHGMPSLAADVSSIQEAMKHFSDLMSFQEHRFVASVSTDDLGRLLNDRFVEIAQQNAEEASKLSGYIVERHGGPNGATGSTSPSEAQAFLALGEITRRARELTEANAQRMRPFTVLSDLVARILQHRAINLTGALTLGDSSKAINSDLLSSGEKQMLSFLCYNAFARGASIFIDEPEISLHVDWQRVLFPILLSQSTGNQFIVATHSPFIYSKYADKELMLAPTRGDEDADALDDGGRDHRLPREDKLADVAG